MMTRFMSAEMLMALAFVRSGIHTLTLESIRRYGYRLLPVLEKRTGCGWVLQWSNRYLDEVQANFVQVDEAFFVDAKSEMPGFRNNSDVIVDPNSPMLAGIDPNAAPGKPKEQVFMTPGARKQIAEGMAEDDGEKLPV